MTQAFVDHCLELLSGLGPVRARRMFGGHGLYAQDRMVALIAFDRLYLKVDDQTRPHFAEAACEPFVYEGKGKRVTMGYWTVPDDAMESPSLMLPWARRALQAAVKAAAKAALKAAVKPTAAKGAKPRAPKARPRPARRCRPAAAAARRHRANGRPRGRPRGLA